MILQVSTKYQLIDKITVKQFREKFLELKHYFVSETLKEHPISLIDNSYYFSLLRGNKILYLWKLIEEDRVDVIVH